MVDLTATPPAIAYQSRKLWTDRERNVPLNQELSAKSGKLLKRLELKDVVQIEGRWFPKRMIFKGMLKKGKGAEFIIGTIQLTRRFPGIFSIRLR
ncbi:outer membrane lipoprotein-sorting protein [Desulfococcaceae bacterium HSG7]|nr:outer membrane lipoprotein-sorting protein [Desulfococcaceae bacterium HSG7]